jgi:ATP-binding protein involved in chromosome partitioning
MDADIYGPNIPTMLGVDRLPPPNQNKLIPAVAYDIKMISMGLLVKPGQPLIWRGPMLNSAIRQFLGDVEWGELDYLIVDLPPGTGDAALSLAQALPLSGAIIVTLPQLVSLEDAGRGLNMFRQLEVPILGVIENMSYLDLPDGTRMDIFGSGGGEQLAASMQAPFLGRVPIDPEVRVGGDSGKPIVVSKPESDTAKALTDIAKQVAAKVSVAALSQENALPINIVE